MKAIRLRIPGEFEDAFLYMGRLLLIGPDAKVQSIRLATLLDQIASGRTRQLLRILFERNDELNAPGLISAAGTAAAANRDLARLSNEDLAAEAGVESEINLGIEYSAPLDFLVYYRRLYFGTDQGLFSLDINFDSPVATAAGPSARRTEPGCLAVSARYGTVNASCEEHGLFQSIDEFGWLRSGPRNGMERIADDSRRTSWLRHGFVNYVDNTTISLFGTTVEPIPPRGGEEQERHAIAAVEKTDIDHRVAGVLSGLNIEPQDVTHVWSSLNGIFVQSNKGLLFLRFSLDEGIAKEIEVVRLGRGFGSVVWAGTFGRGTVIETDESVIAFENHQMHIIESRPVLVVRTFPNSIWYRRVVATVMEDEVVITSVLRDYMLKLED